MHMHTHTHTRISILPHGRVSGEFMAILAYPLKHKHSRSEQMRPIRMNSLMKFISPLAANKCENRCGHAAQHTHIYEYVCMYACVGRVCVCVCAHICGVQQQECKCCGKKLPQATCCTNQYMWCFYTHTHAPTHANTHSAAKLCTGLPLKLGRTANNFHQRNLLPFHSEDIKKRMLQSAAKACKLFAEF